MQGLFVAVARAGVTLATGLPKLDEVPYVGSSN